MRQGAVSKSNERSNTKFDVRFWTMTALFTAMTYVFTAIVNINLPFAGDGGLIHLGNVPLFIAAILYGRKTGAIAGSFGMGIFDLLSGWALWAPFTFIVVGIMGYVVGAISEKHKKMQWTVLAMVLALIIKVVGYYIAEGIIYGNWIAPALSIPANVIQVVVAAVIVLPISGRLKLVSDKMMGY